MLDTSSSVLETVQKNVLNNLAHPAHKVHVKAQQKMASTFIPILLRLKRTSVIAFLWPHHIVVIVL